MLLVALHGPHRAVERNAISEWWSTTLRLVQHFCKADLLVLAGDMNAAVGSIPAAGIGNLDPEAEDTAGAQLSALAQCFRLWCPGTFASSHQGPSHTYHQKRNGRVCRPDMIFAPLQWASGSVRSFTAADIHAGHTAQDHVAACAEFSLALAGSKRAPMPGRRPIRAADIADPALRTQVEAVLASTPRVPWRISVHAHAAAVTKHIYRRAFQG